MSRTILLVKVEPELWTIKSLKFHQKWCEGHWIQDLSDQERFLSLLRDWMLYYSMYHCAVSYHNLDTRGSRQSRFRICDPIWSLEKFLSPRDVGCVTSDLHWYLTEVRFLGAGMCCHFFKKIAVEVVDFIPLLVSQFPPKSDKITLKSDT